MSSKAEPGSEPVAKQALAQKRDVRHLNTRLEMYVRAQNDKNRQVNQLKDAIARNELEYRTKLKQQQLAFDDQSEQFRKSIEHLELDSKITHQELDQANMLSLFCFVLFFVLFIIHYHCKRNNTLKFLENSDCYTIVFVFI